jgi:DNA-directed RNA polymerase specialized sigma24 family protein
MATTSESLAFDRGVRPVLEIVLPEKADAIIRFRADPELQARIEELARKSTEGELTDDERAEYVGYVRANKFVAILKRQALNITSEPREDNTDAFLKAISDETAKRISPEVASILELRALGYTSEEIATRLGISGTALRKWLSRHRRALKAQLRKLKTGTPTPQ